MSEYRYSFGEDSEDLRDRLILFISSHGMLADVIRAMLKNCESTVQFRQFIYSDDELRTSFHRWLKSRMDWPIQEGEDDFWNMKFAKWFTKDQQREHLLEWFNEEIADSIDNMEDDND